MSRNSTISLVFTCSRQRPTHEPDDVEDLGPVNFPEFISIFRSIDWRHEANKAEWALKATPTVAVKNQNDGCTLWVSSMIAGSYIDVDAEPDERFKVDKYEPWYSVGMKDPPEYSNITTLDPNAIGDSFGITTAALEPVEECFEWFFEEDYKSLYQLFRWT